MIWREGYIDATEGDSNSGGIWATMTAAVMFVAVEVPDWVEWSKNCSSDGTRSVCEVPGVPGMTPGRDLQSVTRTTLGCGQFPTGSGEKAWRKACL
jgi:hypothetical protein